MPKKVLPIPNRRRRIKTARVESQDRKLLSDQTVDRWLDDRWLTIGIKPDRKDRRIRFCNPLRACKPGSVAEAKLTLLKQKAEAIRAEFAIAVDTAMREGVFRINMQRILETHGRVGYELMRIILRYCPAVKLLKNHCKGRSARVYWIKAPGAKPRKSPDETSAQTVDGSAPCLLGTPWVSARPTLVHVSMDVIEDRRKGWLACCKTLGWTCMYDTMDAEGYFASIATLKIDRDVPVPEELTTPCPTPRAEEHRLERLVHFKRIRHQLQHGTTKLFMSTKRGRKYHGISAVPRSIRKHLSWGDERLTEADLSASYWAGLTSRLKDSAVKRMLIELIQSGDFYRRWAKEAGVECDGKFKRAVSIQGLFWKQNMDNPCIRPLWRALDRFAPDLCRMILAVRSKAGVGGLSDYLTWVESTVMFPAFARILAECGRCLPLHDAALVPSSFASRAAEIIADCGAQALGFRPRICSKA